jgi:hypothetical protein
MKHRFFFALLGVLAGCAPSFLGGESWGKAMFSPSPVADQSACDAGFDYGQSQKKLNAVGAVRFQTSKGLVLFNTRLGKLYFLCNSLGWLGGRKPTGFSEVFTSDVMFEDASMVGKTAQIAISLEDEQGKEIARLNAEKGETEGNRQWYTPKRYSPADIEALNKAKSFTILLNRGSREERYKINSTFTAISPTQEVRVDTLMFSPQIRQAMKEAN